MLLGRRNAVLLVVAALLVGAFAVVGCDQWYETRPSPRKTKPESYRDLRVIVPHEWEPGLDGLIDVSLDKVTDEGFENSFLSLDNSDAKLDEPGTYRWSRLGVPPGKYNVLVGGPEFRAVVAVKDEQVIDIAVPKPADVTVRVTDALGNWRKDVFEIKWSVIPSEPVKFSIETVQRLTDVEFFTFRAPAARVLVQVELDNGDFTGKHYVLAPGQNELRLVVE